ncbi:chorismate synthase [Candidatus Vidania fulgoroideorum]
MNIIGNYFKVATFGESHGNSVGCLIDGCPAGIKIDSNYIQKNLNKRRPGSSKFVTQRNEGDNIKIISGIYKKKTTGTPIGIIVKNLNKISKDYSNIKNKFRPGHADITYYLKYRIRDHRGGGRSSARTTISLVIAGSIAKKILTKYFNIKIFSYLKKIKNLKIPFIDKKNANYKNFFSPNIEYKKKIENIIVKTLKSNDSVGCVIGLRINGIIPGIGDPLFSKLDSNLLKSIMDLNAVKAVEFGEGIKNSKSNGSINNDQFFKEGFLKNDSGGFLGGITTGQEINLNIYFKPTSSIFKEQSTLNKKFENKKILIKGRHDPCVGLRAAPIIESISSIIIIDSIMSQKINSFF